MNPLSMLCIVILLGSASVFCGCATNLQRGDKAMRKGRYRKAEKYYLRALNKEKDAALLPVWRGGKYKYSFKAPSAAAGILGVAKANRELGNTEQAFYSYFHYIQFCIRHGIDFGSELDDISSFVEQNQDSNEKGRLEELIKQDH